MIQTTLTGVIVEDAIVRRSRSGVDFLVVKVVSYEKERSVYFFVTSSVVSMREQLRRGRRVLVSGRMSYSAVIIGGEPRVSFDISASVIELQDYPKQESVRQEIGVKNFDI